MTCPFNVAAAVTGGAAARASFIGDLALSEALKQCRAGFRFHAKIAWAIGDGQISLAKIVSICVKYSGFRK
jgi:hypothetical protein